MRWGDYLLGLAFFAGTSGAVVIASVLVVRRRLPFLERSSALVAAALLATAGVLVVHLVPGVLGVLSRASALACALAVLALAAFGLRGNRPSESDRPKRQDSPPLSNLIAGAAAAGAVAFWVAGAWKTLGRPTRHIDTLTFHLPDVARWIQTGSFWGVHQFVPLQVDGYYPQTGDVLFVATVLPWMNDAFVNGVNAVFAAVAALAVYAIARELGGRQAHALLAAALFASVPVLITTSLKGAQTDTIMAATFGGGILFLLRHARSRRRSELLLAGVGLGLAFGSKWSGVSNVVAIVAVWAIALLVARRPPGRVVRDAGVVTAVVALVGGFWLLRNWVNAGNPLFPVEVELAGLTVFDAPRHLLGECANFTVASYLGDPRALRGFLLPAYRDALGLTGLVALIAVPAAAGLAIWSIGGRARFPQATAVVVAAAGALVLVAVYAVTPGSALGLRGAPVNVSTQTRYLLPALLLGAALLGWALGRVARARLPFELVTFAVIAFSLVGAGVLPATRISLIVLAFAVLGTVIAVRARPQPFARRPVALAVAVTLCAGLLALGYERQQQFNEQRYRGLDPTLDWILERAPRGQQIALAGRWTVRGPAPVLPAFGPRLGNEVTYLGRFEDGHLREYKAAPIWRRALARGGYDLLLVGRGGYGGRGCPIPGREGDDAAWARAAGLPQVARSARFTLYRIPSSGT